MPVDHETVEVETFCCQVCGADYEDEDDAERCCMHECEECGSLWHDEDDAYHCCRGGKRPDPEAAWIAASYVEGLSDWYVPLVPALPNRPARLVSCEQEVNGGGVTYSDALERVNGIPSYDDKEDGSLGDGGREIVWDRMRLSDRATAKRYGKALQLADRLRLNGALSDNQSAGHHIHVAAKDANGRSLNPGDLATLYGIFCHVEDALYRIASCGWSAHRGEGYNRTLMKLDNAKPREILKLALTDQDRYFGLNLHPTYYAMRSCHCGTQITGEWSDCECGASNAATVEWRLFNMQTDPRVIHAWIVLATALTELSTRGPEKFGNLPYNSFRRCTMSEIPAAIDSRTDQLRWILDNAPLTKDERQLILWVAWHSPGMKDASERNRARLKLDALDLSPLTWHDDRTSPAYMEEL